MNTNLNLTSESNFWGWEGGVGFYMVKVMFPTIDDEIGQTFDEFITEVDTFGCWMFTTAIKNIGIKQLIEDGVIPEFALGCEHKVECWEKMETQF